MNPNLILTLAVIALVLNALVLVGVIWMAWRVSHMVSRLEARALGVVHEASAVLGEAKTATSDARRILSQGRKLLGGAAVLRLARRAFGPSETAGVAVGLSVARLLRHYLKEAQETPGEGAKHETAAAREGSEKTE